MQIYLSLFIPDGKKGGPPPHDSSSCTNVKPEHQGVLLEDHEAWCRSPWHLPHLLY